MRLASAVVGPFRSINAKQTVNIDPSITVFVGMNEAGKTVFLKALTKANDALSEESFDPTSDYPRKDYTGYMKRHSDNPEEVVVLKYELSDKEIAHIHADVGVDLERGFAFSINHRYDNSSTIGIQVPESPILKQMAATQGLSQPASDAVSGATNLRDALARLQKVDRNDADEKFFQAISDRVNKTKWNQVIAWEVWQWLSIRIPKFLYFSDYDLLPGKLNLKDLANRVAAAAADQASANKHLNAKHRAVLALLRMADVSVNDFAGNTAYEPLKAKVEAISISLTDDILEFWKQNEDLEVEVDIRTDTTDEAPFNDGPNLYLRIKNRRHRGVSTPFDQRSRGFIWFFSFLVWFDSVQHQLDPTGKGKSAPLILLLDEPGLALHALAQADFLNYIDNLAKSHQVIYTTHSPFMVRSDRLHQVRVVEDKPKDGTIISENLVDSDERTIFPLQAALGWTIAQNLFIAERNLLVEGPSELAYLTTMSALLSASGQSGLDESIVIVPVGGLANVATFISLLGANGLTLAVLHDYNGRPEQKIDNLVQQRLVAKKLVFNASQFRDPDRIGENTAPTDIEDLISPQVYLEYFNRTFAAALQGQQITEADLPAGDRVVLRIERALEAKGIQLRPNGGFNHYLVAVKFAQDPPTAIDKYTQSCFSSLFTTVNRALTAQS